MAQIVELLCNVCSETAEADQKNVFHTTPSFLNRSRYPTVTLACGNPEDLVSAEENAA